MNKIFKVVWSKVKHCYVVVSEIAKNTTSGGARRCRMGKVSLAAAMAAAVLTGSFAMPNSAWAENGQAPANSYVAIHEAGLEYITDLGNYEKVNVGGEWFYVRIGFHVTGFEIYKDENNTDKVKITEVSADPLALNTDALQSTKTSVDNIFISDDGVATTRRGYYLKTTDTQTYAAVTNGGGTTAFVQKQEKNDDSASNLYGYNLIVNNKKITDGIDTWDNKYGKVVKAKYEGGRYYYESEDKTVKKEVNVKSVYYLTSKHFPEGNDKWSGDNAPYVFLYNSGTDNKPVWEVYDGVVYGNNGEVLSTGVDGKDNIYTFWASESNDLYTPVTKMTVSELNTRIEEHAKNMAELAKADFNSVLLTPASDNSQNNVIDFKDFAGDTIDSINVSVTGGTVDSSGNSTGNRKVLFSNNEKGRFELETGSIVSALVNEPTSSTEIKGISINGVEYKIASNTATDTMSSWKAIINGVTTVKEIKPGDDTLNFVAKDNGNVILEANNGDIVISAVDTKLEVPTDGKYDGTPVLDVGNNGTLTLTVKDTAGNVVVGSGSIADYVSNNTEWTAKVGDATATIGNGDDDFSGLEFNGEGAAEVSLDGNTITISADNNFTVKAEYDSEAKKINFYRDNENKENPDYSVELTNIATTADITSHNTRIEAIEAGYVTDATMSVNGNQENELTITKVKNGIESTIRFSDTRNSSFVGNKVENNQATVTLTDSKDNPLTATIKNIAQADDLSALAGRVTTNEKGIETNTSNITTLTEKVTANTKSIISHDTRIQTIEDGYVKTASVSSDGPTLTLTNNNNEKVTFTDTNNYVASGVANYSNTDDTGSINVTYNDGNVVTDVITGLKNTYTTIAYAGAVDGGARVIFKKNDSNYEAYGFNVKGEGSVIVSSDKNGALVISADDKYVNSATYEDNKLTITRSDGEILLEKDLSGLTSGLSSTDYRLIHATEPIMEGKQGYVVREDGTVDLKVQNGNETASAQTVTIGGIATKGDITRLTNKVDAGWNLKAGNNDNWYVVKPDSNYVTLVSGNENLDISRDGGTVTFTVSKNPVFDGVTVGGDNDNSKVVINDSGINMSGQKITGLADGAIESGSKEAINGGQLDAVRTELTDNDKYLVSNPGPNAEDGKYTVDNNSVTLKVKNGKNDNGADTYADVVIYGIASKTELDILAGKVDNAATEASKKTTVTGSSNITVTPVTDSSKANEYNVALNNDITLTTKDTNDNNNVIGQVAIKSSDSTVIVGIDNNNKVSINGANGTITAGDRNGTNVSINATTGNIVATTKTDDNVTGQVTIDSANNKVTVGVGGDENAQVVINGVAGTINGLKNKEWSKDYTITSGQAATEDQLQQAVSILEEAIEGASSLASKHSSVSNGDSNIVITSDTLNANGGVDYKVSLSEEVNVEKTLTVGDSDNKIFVDGVNGTVAVGKKVSIDGTDGDATFGNVTVNTDNAGTINGLKNTEWGGNYQYVSGQAATEDQLHKAVTTINTNINAAKTEVNGSENIKVTSASGSNGQTIYTVSGTDTIKAGKVDVASDGSITLEHVNAEGEVNGVSTRIEGLHDYVIDKQTQKVTDGEVTLKVTDKYNSKNTYDVKITDVASASKLEKVEDKVDSNTEKITEHEGHINNLYGNDKILSQNIDSRINQVNSRVNKVGAGAAALAALHPMDFDPDDKLSFSAGVGNYAGQTATALGAFYRPNEKVMMSIGGTYGNNENMVNMGVSFALDRTNNISNSRTAMAREIVDLREQVATQGQQIAQLVALVNQLVGVKEPVAPTVQPFPDVPANHWAYEYLNNLVAMGVIEGYPDGTFGGDRTMTRYEFATMLFKAMQNGAVLSEQIRQEFNAELGRIRVDRIKGADDDANKIERVRVNNYEDRDDYGSKIVMVSAGK